jgi:hypothetical protein
MVIFHSFLYVYQRVTSCVRLRFQYQSRLPGIIHGSSAECRKSNSSSAKVFLESPVCRTSTKMDYLTFSDILWLSDSLFFIFFSLSQQQVSDLWQQQAVGLLPSMPSTLPGKQQMPWFRRWGMKYDLDSTRLVGVLTSPSTARIRMLQPWQWPWCLWCAMQIWSNHIKSGSFHVHSMGFFRGIQTDSHKFQVLALCSTDQHCQHHSSQDSFWRGPGSFSFFSQPSKFVQPSRDFCGCSLRELLQILSCAVVHFREVMIVMQICQCLITRWTECQDLPLINFGELMTEQFMAWTTNSAIYSRNGHLAVVNCLAELTKLSEAEPVSLWIYGPFTSVRNLSPL